MAIITVSREYGCEARPLGRALAESFGYSYVDKESILEIVRKHGAMRGKLKIEISEFDSSMQEKFDNSFKELVALEENAIFDYALTENTVIVGRGGNCLLKDVPYALHIRLVAPIEERIANIVQRIKISPDHAKNLIKQSDSDRSCYIRTIYDQDWADPLNYDVVFDMSKHTGKEITELITCLIAEKNLQITEMGKDKLAKRALAAKVKAAVITSHEIKISSLLVYHDGKNIVMDGIVTDPEIRNHAEVIARSITGNEPFVSKLH